ncbi:MAG: Asp-tRNA(Asn)/Glu-tRNA(Gln) amidotransferase subunit GatC [Gammaproteobacteria bacterium]|nr:Asp-tRNA(Asn)/Glu-tRNA(Gln) amidotransferase subunit GatC [Gammaproteobacteria bacterium]MCI0590901.1 Asp-tRNA(Asn)/Glu-tRNA(Gln) amidotransferase subunit GatC [Gammaproteobacteria bacterium]
MSLQKKDVEKIAWLARLALSEQEVSDYARDLSDIFELVKQMNTVDTEGVLPLAHPLEITARLRRDEVVETNERDRFQSIAPLVKNGHYLVPKVIE